MLKTQAIDFVTVGSKTLGQAQAVVRVFRSLITRKLSPSRVFREILPKRINFESREAILDLKKKLEEEVAAWTKAYNRGDAAGCTAIYAENAMMLPPNQPIARGKQAIKEFNQWIIDQVGGTHSTSIIEFGVEGDLAYQVGTYAMTDTKTPDQGKFVNIFRRQQDGSWKLQVAIFNSDQPLPTST